MKMHEFEKKILHQKTLCIRVPQGVFSFLSFLGLSNYVFFLKNCCFYFSFCLYLLLTLTCFLFLASCFLFSIMCVHVCVSHISYFFFVLCFFSSILCVFVCVTRFFFLFGSLSYFFNFACVIMCVSTSKLMILATKGALRSLHHRGYR